MAEEKNKKQNKKNDDKQKEVLEVKEQQEDKVDEKVVEKIQTTAPEKMSFTDFLILNFESINKFLNDVDYLDTKNNERHKLWYFLNKGEEFFLKNYSHNKNNAEKLLKDIKEKFNY